MRGIWKSQWVIPIIVGIILAVVLINAGAKENTVTVDLSKLSSSGTSAQVVRTSGSIADGEHWAVQPDLPVEKNSVCAVLSPNSITTLIISDVAL